MKRYLFSLISILFLAGCSINNTDQNSVGDNMYDKYKVIIDYLETEDFDSAISEISKMKNKGLSAEINEQCREAGSLSYYEDTVIYETRATNNGGECYDLVYYKDSDETCTFFYSNGQTPVECLFSKEVYFHLLDIICSTELKELPVPTDENGKLIEKRVTDCIRIICRNKPYFFDEIANKDEVIKFFKDLRDSALE